jgi:predicted nucleic acid-binding protein
MRLPSCLVDTNVLLRVTKQDDPLFPEVSRAVGVLLAADTTLFYTYQNVAEMWNVMTRAVENNGFGLAAKRALIELQAIEQAMSMLPEDESSYRRWRDLLQTYEIRGVQVHDTRLVAAMLAHGVRHILTLNGSHFARFPEIQVVYPQSVLQ